jgi:hypothetical protein
MFIIKRFAPLGVLVAIISLLPIAVSPAIAAAKATVSNGTATSFSTGTFIAYAEDAAAVGAPTFTNPGAALSGLAVSNGVGKNFFVENGGTLPLTGITMTITLKSPPAGGTITSLKNCNQNVLFVGATATCAGATPVTTNNPTNGVAKTYTMNIAAGAWFEFQLLENKNTTATISVSVSNTQTTTFTLNS